MTRRLLTVSLAMLFALASAGCASKMDQTGQYADAKEKWDSSRPPELEDSLRLRLATTQRDN